MSTNGVDFVIGGKDQASAPMAAVGKSMQRLESGTKSVKTATQGLISAMGPLLAIYAAVKTAMAAVGGIRAANEAFDAQTESVRKLNAALAIRGASKLSGEMQKAASDLEKLTGVSDNATMALMHQASGMGFAAGAMDDAAKAATGLAQATGKDAAGAMGDLKAALEGNFEAFHQVNPQIMFMRTNQEKLAAVMAIAGQGLNDLSGDMYSVLGSGRRAESAITTLMETFGKILAPIRVLINSGLQFLAENLTSVLAPAAAYATQVLENIGPVIQWVKEKVVAGINLMIGAFTFFETILTNLSSVWDMVSAYAESAMLQVTGAIMHALTVQIPAYATWFGQNFVNILRDAFVGAYTIVKNHVLKIFDALTALWNFIASGGHTDLMAELGAISGRSYLEGFQSSLTALPEIAGRQLTEREKEMAERIGEIGGRLGQQFADSMAERMIGVGDGVSAEMANATNAINLKSRAAVIMQGNQATEGRLLTRGPGTRIPDLLTRIANTLDQINKKTKPIRFVPNL